MACVLLAAVFNFPAGFGASARVVNLIEMVDAADRVFRGQCISVTPAGSVAGLPILEYVFDVSEGFKGLTSGEQIVFRQVQGAGNRIRGVPGLPVFQKGQEVILFLYPNSRLGLTSPVGLAQGGFRVLDDGEQASAINGLSNRNLTEGIDEAQAQEAGLGPAEMNALRTSGPVPLDVLRRAVHGIESRSGEKGYRR